MSVPSESLCPYEDRRTPRELYLKLFVVCFTVLASLSHLIHVHRDYGIGVSLMIFAITSLIIVAAYLVLPFPLLLIQAIVVKGNRKLLKKSAAALIGQMPKEDEETESLESGISGIILLKSLPLLGILAQSTVSTYTFVLRCQSGGDALYDHYVFQLTLISVFSLTLSLVHCFFKFTFPVSQWGDLPANIRWLVTFRPVPGRTHKNYWRWRKATRSKYRTDAFNGSLIFTLFASLGSLTSSMTYISRLNVVNGFNILRLLNWLFAAIMLFLIAICAAFLLVSILSVYLMASRRSSWKELWDWRLNDLRLSFVLLSSVIPSILLSAVTMTVILFPVIASAYTAQILLASPIWPIANGQVVNQSYSIPSNNTGTNGLATNSTCIEILEQGLFMTQPVWNRIAAFKEVPTYCPCPKALKSDVGDALWALA